MEDENDMPDETRPTLDINRTWVILFAGFTLAVLAGGYGYYRAEESRISREKYREIKAIAELKEGQIRQWRSERLAGVFSASESMFFRRALQEWRRTGFASAGRAEWRRRLSLERLSAQDDALLLSPEGNVLLSVMDDTDHQSPETRRAALEALSSGKAVLSDLFRCPHGRIHIDAVAPVRDTHGVPIALLVQRNDAATYLYPLIQSWLIPSNSAESFLIQRQGDWILYLNELRHQTGAALSLRIPLTRTDVPAVQAVKGKKGRFRGIDYRGVEVLADLRPVAGTPWFLIAKVDAAEILAEARYRAVVIALAAVCFILLAAMATAYAYRRKQAGIYMDLYRSEREQREARDEFRTILYSIDDAVITTDREGKVRRMNQVAEQLTGWHEAEAHGKPLDEVFHVINEATRSPAENPVQRVLNEGRLVVGADQAILVSGDGTKRPIDHSGSPIRDERCEITGVALVFRDITGRKAVEDALREREEMYRLLVDNLQNAVVYQLTATPDGGRRFTYVSRAVERLNETTVEEVLADAGVIYGQVLPEYQAMVRACEEEALKNTASLHVEVQSRLPSGRIRWFEYTSTPHRRADGQLVWDGVQMDITERKRAEEALRESEERVRTKLNAILLPEGEIEALELDDIIDVQALQRLMDDYFAMENLVTAIVDIHGKVLVATGWQDICTKFHRVHPETCGNCIESDTILSAGIEPGAFKLYKCKNNLWDLATPIIVGGRHLGNLFSGQFLLEDEEPDYGIFRDQARRYGFNEKDYLAALERVPRWNREKINRVMTFFAGFAQMISGLSYANIKLARILTEREKMEAQFLQAQKMEAVGRLAGGVAHDFNNMLNVILGYADMALLKLEPSSPIQGYLKEISRAGLRSADLTRQLLAFARKQTIAPKILDLNDTVAGMLKMLMRLIGEDIELTWKPAPALWPVNLDPAQIDQILANLVVNARDAISGVGRILIETGTVEFDQAYCDRHAGLVPGRYVLLAVSDNGCGMGRETLDRLFEPFFTTKEVGKGTGLGLATVYGIVQQNSGFITVDSEPGKGTTFRIYLPPHQSEQTIADETQKAAQTPTGTETVLLVEDEASLLDLGALLLEDLGYTVLPASGPNHALRLADEYAGEIDLLLTDVIMPDMSGSDLCKEIATRRPNLKSLFMSGYTAEAVAHHGVLHEGVHFLQKPFSVQDLAVKLREALNG